MVAVYCSFVVVGCMLFVVVVFVVVCVLLALFGVRCQLFLVC